MPKFISEIKPSSNFALVDSSNVRGGFMQVATIEERDAIVPDKLKKGMLVYVESTEQLYTYKGDSWIIFEVSSTSTEGGKTQFLTLHTTVETITEEEEYYKISFKDDIFIGNDLIGYNIKDDLSGTYVQIVYTENGYAYISKDNIPPDKYQVVYLMGSAEHKERALAIILHEHNGAMVLSQFLNISLDNINTNYIFRLGQSALNTWRVYGEDVYFKGTFISNDGKDLASVVSLNSDAINTGLTSLRQEFGYENLLNNPYFIDGLDCWLTQNTATYFKANGKFVMSNKTLLSTKKDGAYVIVEDNQIVLRLINGFVKQKNENLRKITTDLDELPELYYVTLIFTYKVVKDGTLSVAILTNKEVASGDTTQTFTKTDVKVSKELPETSEYQTFRASFLWGGNGDFALNFSEGEIKIQAIVLKMNDVRTLEKKYEELFAYSDTLIKMAKEYNSEN